MDIGQGRVLLIRLRKSVEERVVLVYGKDYIETMVCKSDWAMA
jgi:hypothetical protein